MPASAALVTVVVALAAVVCALGLLTAVLVRQGAPAPGPRSGIRRRDEELAGGAALGTTNVIPLVWNASAGIFEVQFTAGKGQVSAAFDTGSARFIVDKGYTPSDKALAIVDPRKVPDLLELSDSELDDLRQQPDVLCSTEVAYVSQTDKVQMVQDDIAFPRKEVQDAELCVRDVDTVVADASDANPFVITDFPIGRVVQSTGTSLNVFGMSPVQSATIIKIDGQQYYLLPYCQTERKQSNKRAPYESALLEALARYYEAINHPLVWSMFVGDKDGFMVFADMRLACLDVKYSPMVRTLSNSTSALVSTPYRFYVVNVESIQIGTRGDPSSLRALPSPPKQVLVDTGTTQFLLPGSTGALNASALSNLSSDQVAVLTLQGGVVITYGPDDLQYNIGGRSRPVFADMPDNVARTFSTNLDVGIMGITAMRHMYIEYDLSQLRVGFGMPLLSPQRSPLDNTA